MVEIRFFVFLIVFIISRSAVSAQLSLAPHRGAIQARLLTSGIECLKDNPLSMQDIKALRARKLAEGDASKCFAACLFKNLGIMDDKNKLSSANTQRTAKQIFKGQNEYIEKVERIVEICSVVNDMPIEGGNERCERAKLIFNCLIENGPKLGFELKL